MTKPEHFPDSAFAVEDFKAFTPEDLASGAVVVNKIRFNSNGQLTDSIVHAGGDAITVESFDFKKGLLKGHNRYHRDIVLSFEDGGIPIDKEGSWNPLVCTVPGTVGMKLMKDRAAAEHKRRASTNQHIGLLTSNNPFPEVLVTRMSH